MRARLVPRVGADSSSGRRVLIPPDACHLTSGVTVEWAVNSLTKSGPVIGGASERQGACLDRRLPSC